MDVTPRVCSPGALAASSSLKPVQLGMLALRPPRKTLRRLGSAGVLLAVSHSGSADRPGLLETRNVWS
jgi:hypothetical protein